MRERTEKGKTSVEVQYYICSCEIDAHLLEKVVRGHWGIESMHWELDVTFREDQLRYRERVGAQNLATIRKLTLGVLARDKTLKCGKAGKSWLLRQIPNIENSFKKLLLMSSALPRSSGVNKSVEAKEFLNA